jgi:hypothetical protein
MEAVKDTTMSENDVVIENEALIPDQYCMAEITMPYYWWQALLDLAAGNGIGGEDIKRGVVVKRVPQLSVIAEALQQPCPQCGGDPAWHDAGYGSCRACNRTGKASVPGASLRSRRVYIRPNKRPEAVLFTKENL